MWAHLPPYVISVTDKRLAIACKWNVNYFLVWIWWRRSHNPRLTDGQKAAPKVGSKIDWSFQLFSFLIRSAAAFLPPVEFCARQRLFIADVTVSACTDFLLNGSHSHKILTSFHHNRLIAYNVKPIQVVFRHQVFMKIPTHKWKLLWFFTWKHYCISILLHFKSVFALSIYSNVRVNTVDPR